MSGLTAFQDAFTLALAGDDDALGPWVATAGDQAGLRVYRNTVAAGLAEALAATFPTVQRLVGEAWFEAAAVAFARERPPAEPSLLAYGGDFPAWLAAFGPARDLPYLPGVARLDWMWLEAHLAADAAPIGPEAFAGLAPGDLEHTAAVLHPSARLAWFDDNTPSLWRANRPPAEPPASFALDDRGEGLLIARPSGEVVVQPLDAGAHAFIAACAAGRPLAVAAVQALAAEPSAELSAIVQTCLDAGLFTALHPTETSS